MSSTTDTLSAALTAATGQVWTWDQRLWVHVSADGAYMVVEREDGARRLKRRHGMVEVAITPWWQAVPGEKVAAFDARVAGLVAKCLVARGPA